MAECVTDSLLDTVLLRIPILGGIFCNVTLTLRMTFGVSHDTWTFFLRGVYEAFTGRLVFPSAMLHRLVMCFRGGYASHTLRLSHFTTQSHTMVQALSSLTGGMFHRVERRWLECCRGP